MRAKEPSVELLRQLDAPFTAEALFDCLPDVVYFIKNRRGEYVVVNRTMVERCGRSEKSEVLGRRADEVFPAPFGRSYRAQDDYVLRTGEPVMNALELQARPGGGMGWCLTFKLPLRLRGGEVGGLVGFSRDLVSRRFRRADYGRIAGAVVEIQEQFGGVLRVGELAARSGLSEYQFEMRMRAVFGLTAGQFILKTRMDAAVRLLSGTEGSIAEVAQACGYSDQSAFARQFRQTVGVTPAAFRKATRRSRIGG